MAGLRVRIENLEFGFNARKIFKDFSLDLGGGDPVVILGPSGCGKTTLLRLIAGLLRPEAGRIMIENAAASGGAASFVFQEARLLPYLNVLQNVMLPTVKPLGRLKAEERARFFLRESAIYRYAGTYPDQLSGGQRQRVSIARAWAYPAPIILMDEPFQSLDIPLRIQLMDSVRKLKTAEDRFVIAVTHDPREAVYLGRRIIVLGCGADGSAGILFDEKFDAETPRAFVSEAALLLEQKLCDALSYRPETASDLEPYP
jgi:NitT/TauT family transport system ATP-binding protein